MSKASKRAKLPPASAASAPHLCCELLVDIFACVGGLLPSFAIVNRTWAAAMQSYKQTLANTPLLRAMSLDGRALTLLTADTASVDLAGEKNGWRKLRFMPGSRIELVGGPPARDLVLSGPRSAVVAFVKGQPALARKAAAAGGGAGDTAPALAASDEGQRKTKPLRPVKVSGDSVFRGVQIEGNIVVSSGHLVMVRCTLRGTIKILARAKLTMFECTVSGTFAKDAETGKSCSVESEYRQRLVNVGKGASCTLDRCTFSTACMDGVHAADAGELDIRRCSFVGSEEGFSRAIVLSCGQNRCMKGCDALSVRGCTFTDMDCAIMLVRCKPKAVDIDGVDIVRAHGHTSRKNRAIFANYPGGLLRVKNLRFTDDSAVPLPDDGSAGAAHSGAPHGRPPGNMLVLMGGVGLALDATAEMMALPFVVTHQSFVLYCRDTVVEDAVAMVEEERKAKCVAIDERSGLPIGYSPEKDDAGAYGELKFNGGAWQSFEFMPTTFDHTALCAA